MSLFHRVSIGSMVLGTIERRNRHWIARGPDWQEIGVYVTEQDAFDAVWCAHLADPAVALLHAEPTSLEIH